MPAFLGGPPWPEFDAAIARFDLGGAARIATADAVVEPAERLLAAGVCLSLAGPPAEAEEALYDSFRRFCAQESPRAAMAAVFLGRLHFFAYDSVHVANGWFARARAVAARGGAPERAWAAFPLPACFLPDPAQLETEGQRALAAVRQGRGADLEAKLLADLGTARVTLGKLVDGMAGIDEAMAMLVGREATSPLAAIDIVCDLATSCERAGDLERARQWLEQAERHLGLGHRAGPPFLYVHCQSSLGLLLAGLGRWEEADAAVRVAADRAGSLPRHSENRLRAAADEVRRRAPRPVDPLAPLSPREREVLAFLPEGLTNAQIAGRLHNSVRTIDHHVSSILTKLSLRSRTEAAVLAASTGRDAAG